ncbi:hypothetical protein P5673_025267 [Acropora cervicornis]|uniref:Uncharacterized protein n=1 Tax=Acropora cervicornis TaxID=6130 RepID=A0AAD9UXG5_ACRCE|nr:hypothetical protein P5673_025267 [Acropora cervicornis]
MESEEQKRVISDDVPLIHRMRVNGRKMGRVELFNFQGYEFYIQAWCEDHRHVQNPSYCTQGLRKISDETKLSITTDGVTSANRAWKGSWHVYNGGALGTRG